MKVLVLEKHGKCGGKNKNKNKIDLIFKLNIKIVFFTGACHIFKAEGYEFDVGIHYIGGFNRPTLNRTLLEQISDGQINWASMGKFSFFLNQT